MSESISNLTIINTLKVIGLTHSEAIVYLALLKYGESGTRVLDLITTLKPMKRTTLYSVLSKLEELGCATISEKVTTPRNARIYAAVSPITFLQHKINGLQDRTATFNGT